MKYRERLEKAILNLIHIQDLYSYAGAADTEPDGIWQSVVFRKFKGYEVNIPTTIDDWQLYSPAGKAPRALTGALKKVLNVIDDTPINDRIILTQIIENYCWRVT